MKTDTQLQDDVFGELDWEPSVDTAKIRVKVTDGMVTLTGQVRTYAEKWDSERAAQRVSGVKALANELDVTLLSLGKRTDAAIARAVEDVLKWTMFLSDNAVRVTVEDGWITLSGEVDWPYQRQAAVDAVRYLVGVTGISDQIGIHPKSIPTNIKSAIEAALNRRGKQGGRHISVEVHDADVTLTGKVHSWLERDMAAHDAWDTPGVRTVVDNLTIAY
jgi:osmotically-inducible protein OsmY